jgi:hypothetical protein
LTDLGIDHPNLAGRFEPSRVHRYCDIGAVEEESVEAVSPGRQLCLVEVHALADGRPLKADFPFRDQLFAQDPTGDTGTVCDQCVRGTARRVDFAADESKLP